MEPLVVVGNYQSVYRAWRLARTGQPGAYPEGSPEAIVTVAAINGTPVQIRQGTTSARVQVTAATRPEEFLRPDNLSADWLPAAPPRAAYASDYAAYTPRPRARAAAREYESDYAAFTPRASSAVSAPEPAPARRRAKVSPSAARVRSTVYPRKTKAHPGRVYVGRRGKLTAKGSLRVAYPQRVPKKATRSAYVGKKSAAAKWFSLF